MQNKDGEKILKIVVIIAIILAVISLILPWRGLSMSYSMSGFGSYSAGFDFYPWATHLHMSTSISSQYQTTANPSFDVWSIFYMINTGTNVETLSTQSGTTTSFTTTDDIGATASLFISFIFCIITIILGILILVTKRFKICLTAGISAIISIIAFVVGLSIVFSKDPTGMVSSIIPYTFGFYMMIISAVLFFVVFGLRYAITAMTAGRGMYLAYGPPQTTGYNYPPKEGFESKPSHPYYSTEKRRCPACGAVIDGNPEICINCSAKLK